eukprot:CAMPEP_0170438060 /NCGR_PEP_ID=MMETSP0117_2-20130122/45030_1 /TAXON_ID=400756 /ORGANISM="Durinskia baltica, Strain CSIRO CS-38" /LENGTH=151 /DNA_ID=CAMNT_0010698251 /DNA_START=201 /DNA_END=656 /DNA_ORIENTATION=+
MELLSQIGLVYLSQRGALDHSRDVRVRRVLRQEPGVAGDVICALVRTCRELVPKGLERCPRRVVQEPRVVAVFAMVEAAHAVRDRLAHTCRRVIRLVRGPGLPVVCGARDRGRVVHRVGCRLPMGATVVSEAWRRLFLHDLLRRILVVLRA